MLKKIILVAGLCVALQVFGPACTGNEEQEPVEVKTMQEYREEAAQDITKENAEEELDKLKKEIEADMQ